MRSIEDETGKTPQALREKVELPEALRDYWNGFGVLYMSRGISNTIPLSEICVYLDEFGIFGMDERLEYIFWIQFIDNEYQEPIKDGRATSNDK